MRALRRTLTVGTAMLALLAVARNTPAQNTNANDSAAAVVRRAAAAHGRANSAADPADWVADGKLTLYTPEGGKTFDVIVQHRGTQQVQRIIKQPVGDVKHGTNGTQSWESVPGFYTLSAQGRALQFIESQTVRSPQRLFNHQAEGLSLREKGSKDAARVIESEDGNGKKTSYYIDNANSRVTKFEFVIGQARNAVSGAAVDVLDTWVLSDYRTVQGQLTPFKLERFNNGAKTEEMQFSSVKYNTGLKDQDFHR